MIGSVPSGRGVGQLGTGGAAARRINPIGGLLGEGEGKGAVGSRRGVGIGGTSPADRPAGMYGSAGGRRAGRREEDETHWDPDNPWETAEGVDPVMLPTEIKRVDPGPAIGLG